MAKKDGKKKPMMALVISVGPKMPKKPEDTATPDGKAMKKAWNFMKENEGSSPGEEISSPYTQQYTRRPLPPIKRGELNSRDKLVEDARQKFYAQGRVPGEGITNRLRRQYLRQLAYHQMTPDEYRDMNKNKQTELSIQEQLRRQEEREKLRRQNASELGDSLFGSEGEFD